MTFEAYLFHMSNKFKAKFNKIASPKTSVTNEITEIIVITNDAIVILYLRNNVDRIVRMVPRQMLK